MSDKASLIRILRELKSSNPDSRAGIETQIINLFDSIRDEGYESSKRLTSLCNSQREQINILTEQLVSARKYNSEQEIFIARVTNQVLKGTSLVVELYEKYTKLRAALEWYYYDDMSSVVMGTLESVKDRPAYSALDKE